MTQIGVVVCGGISLLLVIKYTYKEVCVYLYMLLKKQNRGVRENILKNVFLGKEDKVCR